MNDQKHDGGDGDKVVVDDVMLPGFRFHPTDEELVGFYLKRKMQQRPLSIELIKQVDIYKYDPWDLSKLAATGEKEWYFYCPRDRKYRNSARPNRVTASGFWKATGTDRPIYTSDGSKCIGLKKSLVFYRGRAAKGMKTDWMMHEFRLPAASIDSSSPPPKKPLDKALPPNEAWAICRIFKKTNSIAQRALLAHAWQLQTPYPESPTPDIFPHISQFAPLITSENVSSCTSTENMQPNSINASFSSSPLNNISEYKPSFLGSPNGDQYNYPCSHFSFSQPEITDPIYNNNLLADVHNKVSSENPNFDALSRQHCNDYSMSSLPAAEQIQDGVSLMGFPFSLGDEFISTTYSTSKYMNSTENSTSPASQVFN